MQLIIDLSRILNRFGHFCPKQLAIALPEFMQKPFDLGRAHAELASQLFVANIVPIGGERRTQDIKHPPSSVTLALFL